MSKGHAWRKGTNFGKYRSNNELWENLKKDQTQKVARRISDKYKNTCLDHEAHINSKNHKNKLRKDDSWREEVDETLSIIPHSNFKVK